MARRLPVLLRTKWAWRSTQGWSRAVRMERRMTQKSRFGLAIAVLVAIAASYGLGRHYGHSEAVSKSGRHVLYWVDPMHPAYKSDKPGIAPDCGMKLEPVYADGGSAAAPGASRPVSADDLSKMEVGTVQITAEKQQLIGMKYEQVELGGGSRTIRAAGKVAIDETLI